jgi:ubiquinone/menaquinone biosynthesis C-methylase UbiE
VIVPPSTDLVEDRVSCNPPCVGVSHPVFARIYSRHAPKADQQGFADYRKRLLDGLSGRVIEVGAGAGANFPYYPAEVETVLAIEPEPYLRDLALQAATPQVEVVDGVAERLPEGNEQFDAAVVSLALCSVKDLDQSLAEMHRVLRPGGRLRLLEHVRASSPSMVRVQRVLDATVWPLFVGGCHTGRDTVSAAERAGFRMDHVERFVFPVTQLPLPAGPHVLVHATRT